MCSLPRIDETSASWTVEHPSSQWGCSSRETKVMLGCGGGEEVPALACRVLKGGWSEMGHAFQTPRRF